MSVHDPMQQQFVITKEGCTDFLQKIVVSALYRRFLQNTCQAVCIKDSPLTQLPDCLLTSLHASAVLSERAWLLMIGTRGVMGRQRMTVRSAPPWNRVALPATAR